MGNTLFDMPERSSRKSDKTLTRKAAIKKQSNTLNIKSGSGGMSLSDRIMTATATVNKALGKYIDKYDVLRTEEKVDNYITECLKGDAIAIDTETDGLNPLTLKIAGVCLYNPTQKGVYIPMHHRKLIAGTEIDNQLSDKFMKEQMQRIAIADREKIMHTGKFDYRVIKNTLGVIIKPTWDVFIAAKLLNENDSGYGLKILHNRHCAKDAKSIFDYSSLFEGLPFTIVPIESGYLYGAKDAEMTYELWEFQKQYLHENGKNGLDKVYKVFREIEMPLIPVVAEMADYGIAWDRKYNEKLSVDYHKKLDKSKEKFYTVVKEYEQEIDDYKYIQGSKCKLKNPINIASSQQIAILLYDILHLKSGDRRKPRGTGQDAIANIKHPIIKAIKDVRGVKILVDTFIDNMSDMVGEDERIHCNFNQAGTVTWRFSSTNPNMQNIPSKDKYIRQQFTASDGYIMMSADYSAQEPRINCTMAKDERAIKAYNDGRDLYAEFGSIAFDIDYEDCIERRADGAVNAEGKAMRNKAKGLFLAINYDRTVVAIAKDLVVTKQKAQKIYNNVTKSFPGLVEFSKASKRMAIEKGYVTSLFGGKRRLPDMQLMKYEFELSDTKMQAGFDPLDFEEIEEKELIVSEYTIKKYTRMLDKAWGKKQKNGIIYNAREDGIIIIDNSYKISQAERQCVNSRIQRSAGEQIKKAMILIGTDKELKELGFRLLLTVHDELIGEAPKATAKQAMIRFKMLMEQAIQKELLVPSLSDVECSDRWFGKEIIL